MTNNEKIKNVTGDHKKAIKTLSFPLINSMFLIMLNNIIDNIWVAGLGVNQLAAVGFIAPILSILYGLGKGMGAGVNSVLSRHIGAGDKKNANNTFFHSLILCFFMTLIVTVIFNVFLDNFLIIMGAGDILDYALEYGGIITNFSFTLLLPTMFAGIFRAEGQVRRAAIPMAISAVINMVLDPILMYGFHLGLAGNAIGTVTGNTAELILMFYWIFLRDDSYFSHNLKDFKLDFGIFKSILNIGLPTSLEQFLMGVVYILFNMIIVTIGGDAAVAVYTFGWRLLNIAIVPITGVATSTITVAGVAYGAGKYENLKLINRYSIKLAIILSMVLWPLFILGADYLSYIFTFTKNSVELTPYVASFLKIMWIYTIPIAFGSVASYIFQGLGKGKTSLILTTLRELVCSAIFAHLLGVIFNLGLTGAYIGLILGTAIGSAFEFIYLEYHIKKLIAGNETKPAID